LLVPCYLKPMLGKQRVLISSLSLIRDLKDRLNNISSHSKVSNNTFGVLECNLEVKLNLMIPKPGKSMTWSQLNRLSRVSVRKWK
jgi:hypothetical protein